jgi:hypothetical protein
LYLIKNSKKAVHAAIVAYAAVFPAGFDMLHDLRSKRQKKAAPAGGWFTIQFLLQV